MKTSLGAALPRQHTTHCTLVPRQQALLTSLPWAACARDWQQLKGAQKKILSKELGSTCGTFYKLQIVQTPRSTLLGFVYSINKL